MQQGVTAIDDIFADVTSLLTPDEPISEPAPAPSILRIVDSGGSAYAKVITAGADEAVESQRNQHPAQSSTSTNLDGGPAAAPAAATELATRRTHQLFLKSSAGIIGGDGEWSGTASDRFQSHSHAAMASLHSQHRVESAGARVESAESKVQGHETTWRTKASFLQGSDPFAHLRDAAHDADRLVSHNEQTLRHGSAEASSNGAKPLTKGRT